jgi:hypothetical protein
MSSVPRDGTPFLVANYAPTNWAYYVQMVRPPPYMEGQALERYIERNTQWARAWMPCPKPPGKNGTGWTVEELMNDPPP